MEDKHCFPQWTKCYTCSTTLPGVKFDYTVCIQYKYVFCKWQPMVLEWIISDVPRMFLVPHWGFICSSTSLHPSSKYQEPGSHVVAVFVALVMEHGARSDPCRESNSRLLHSSTSSWCLLSFRSLTAAISSFQVIMSSYMFARR